MHRESNVSAHVWQRVRFLLLGLIALYGLALAGGLVLRVMLGDGVWWLLLLNSITPYFFLPLLLMFPLVLLLRSRTVALLLAPLVIIGLLWIGPYYLPKPAPEPEEPTLRVATFNFWSRNRSADDLVQWLREIQPDVVFLQEVPSPWARELFPELADILPYQVTARRRGYIVMTRFPVLSAQPIDYGYQRTLLDQRVVVEVEGQPVILHNIHLLQPQQKEPNLQLPFYIPYTRRAFFFDAEEHHAQTLNLLERLAQENGPMIVAGDFNTSDQAVIYSTIAAQLHDTFREGGFGFGATWPSLVSRGFPEWVPPLFRIDYIWHSPEHFRTIDAAQGPPLGSDHLPLYATLELQGASY